MNFSQLISPTEVTVFFSEYWGKTPLIIQKRARDLYDELLTVDQIDHILTTMWLRSPAVRLVRSGRELGLGYYTKSFNWGSKTFTDVIDVPQMISAYQQGVTIVIEAVHRYWKPLAMFCESITKELSLRLQANVYVSPPNGQGLATHYDTHDVLIMQVYGSKHWRLFEQTIELPNKKFRFDHGKTAVGNLIREVTLSPGDLIYIPRGVGHEATTSELASVHITIGLEFYQWIDLFKRAIEQLENNAEFRESMPPYFLQRQGLSEDEKEHLRFLLARLNELVASSQLVQEIQDQFLSAQMPTYDGLFSTILNLDSIGPETEIRVRHNVLYKIEEQADKVVVMFADKTISFPIHVKRALEVICNKQILAVGKIPYLNEPGRILLAKVLAREGFVSVADDHKTS